MLVQNLHNAVGKAQAQKVLDNLVSKGIVIEKKNGKQVVYWHDQSGFGEVNNEELAKLDAETQELRSTLSELKEVNRKLEEEIRTLSSQLTDAEIDARIIELQKEVV